MATRPTLEEQLMADEGFSPTPYPDSKGFRTVGYGHNLDANPLDRDFNLNPMTREEGAADLRANIASAQQGAAKILPYYGGLDPVRQDAVAMLAYNMGPAGVGKLTRFNEQMAEGNYDEAADILLGYKWAKDVGEKRANSIAAMIREGGEANGDASPSDPAAGIENPDNPSLEDFLPAARKLNPGVSDKRLKQFWNEHFGHIDPATLPTYEEFLPQARPLNPGVSDAKLKAFWDDNFGVFGAALKKPPERDFMRGAETAFKQIPQLASGLEAGAGALGEKLFGEGGISTAIKEHGVKGYNEASEALAKAAHPTDTFSTAWDMAKAGNPGALIDFLQYGLGYATAQGAQMLATGGVGYAVGKLGLQGAAKLIGEKMIAKEAERLGAAEGARLTGEALTKQATANVAARIGQMTALGGAAVGMEGGEIYGDLTSQAAQEGRQLSGQDLAQAFGATLAAGGLEFIGDKIGFDLIVGKSPLGTLVPGMPGVKGAMARGVLQGAGGATAEGLTEAGQSLIEAGGAGRDPFSEDSIREAVDSAALGAVGGGAVGGVSGLMTRPKTMSEVPRAVGLGDPSVGIDEAIRRATAELDETDRATQEANAAQQQAAEAPFNPPAPERTRQPMGEIPILQGPDNAISPPLIQSGSAFAPKQTPAPSPEETIAAERQRLLAMRGQSAGSLQGPAKPVEEQEFTVNDRRRVPMETGQPTTPPTAQPTDTTASAPPSTGQPTAEVNTPLPTVTPSQPQAPALETSPATTGQPTPAPASPAATETAPSREQQITAERERLFKAKHPQAQVPRSELPPVENAEVLLRAQKAEADLGGDERQGPALIPFLRSKGGVQDQGGELSTMEVDRDKKPFTKNLINPNGMTLDDAAEAAHEAGLIRDRDINELLAAIDRETRGIGTQPEWYQALTQGPKPLTKNQIDEAIAKIIQDDGVDRGAAVEKVKEALLGDTEFARSQWGEDFRNIQAGEWPSWMEQPAEPSTITTENGTTISTPNPPKTQLDNERERLQPKKPTEPAAKPRPSLREMYDAGLEGKQSPIPVDDRTPDEREAYMAGLEGKMFPPKFRQPEAQPERELVIKSLETGREETLKVPATPKSPIEQERDKLEGVLTAKQEDAKVAASMRLAQWVAKRLGDQKTAPGVLAFSTTDLFGVADHEFKGTQAQGAYTPKDAFDALELGVNLYLQDVHQLGVRPSGDAASAQQAVDWIRANILDKIPAQQNRRTAEQDEFQQFSTPPDLAFVMNWAGDITSRDTVLEPSAGLGGLAVFADNAGAKVIVNEYNGRRAALLQLLDFDQVFHENAEQLNNILPDTVQPTVVVMNPPFSSAAGRMEGRRDSANVVLHLEQALKRLQPNGRLIALIGKAKESLGGGSGRAVEHWIAETANTYQFRARIGLSGKGYKKYGTTYDNQILIFDKTEPNLSLKPVTATLEDVRDAIPLLEAIRNVRLEPRHDQSAAAQSGSETVAETGASGTRPEHPVSAPTDRLGTPAEDRPGVAGTQERPAAGGVRPAGTVVQQQDHAVSGSGGRGPQSGTGASEPPAHAGGRGVASDTGTRSSPDGSGEQLPAKPDLNITVEQATPTPVHAADVSEDGIYEVYQPQKLKIPGAQAHPGELVQSSAMAAVEPPDVTYTPTLPQSIIRSGKVSIAQLEPVVAAGQSHQQFLPNGERRGYFVGDGTGVGKGREISTIILDNFNQGRTKALWISKKANLVTDARRDWSGIDQDPGQIFDLKGIKVSDTLTQPAGNILFTTYNTLISGLKADRGGNLLAAKDKKTNAEKKSRLEQIVNWLGKDFDGVIAFDESHSMANAVATQGKRGPKDASSTGLVGLELQRRLPKARIVYVSATGATEVANLAYAERLGLWGEGTAFPERSGFIGQMAGGGLAAMELVAQNLKAMGLYLARQLSFRGVTYDRMEHKLTPKQIDTYDEMAKAWQVVWQNISAALDETGGNKNGKSKGAAKGKFVSSVQRFFNQILTSMQMPSVIEDVRKQMEAGNAVLLQLVNTNEASQTREIEKHAEEGEDLEDVDLTPREILMSYVERGFPTQQHEEYLDDNGKPQMRPVYDSQGRPVQNKEAVAMRDALLAKLGSLKVPDGPLEMILDTFGEKMVAEVTGRKERLVRITDEDGHVRRVHQKGRTAKVREADAKQFMEDKKKILVFSDAGGTGMSYHADKAAKNQRKRIHYLIQPGWRADNAVQGFGRSHRSNQKQPPHYILATTDLKGHKRFISSVARRLDQLGALTKGQRQTGTQGFFNEEDNLEGLYANAAVKSLIRDIYQGRVPGMDWNDLVVGKMAYDNLVDGRDGKLVEERLPDTPSFLNRILALEYTEQNAVFDAFNSRMRRMIEMAASRGELDTGLENFQAEHLALTKSQTVYTDPKTKAKTQLLQFEAQHKIDFVPFTEAQKTSKSVGFYKSAKTGKVFVAVKPGTTHTNDAGEVLEDIVLRSPIYGKTSYITTQTLEHSYEKLSIEKARALWEETITTTEPYRKETVHLLSGIMLPIWDRLPQGLVRILRMNTDDGQRYIGRRIQPEALEATKKKLGAASEGAQALTPEDALAQLEDRGGKIVLANGWAIKPARVQGEDRYELTGDDLYGARQELEKAGIFMERIRFDTRWFIPVDRAAEVLAALTKYRPIVEVVGPSGKQAAGGPAYSRRLPDQQEIPVPPPTMGEKPIIAREATPEEAPLFSQAAQEPEPEQGRLAFSRRKPDEATARKILAFNAAIKRDQGVSDAFAWSSDEDTELANVFRKVFGVDIVPIKLKNPKADVFLSAQYRGTLFLRTDEGKHGFLRVAGHELLHQIRKDSPDLYAWFERRGKAYLQEGAERDYAARLAATGTQTHGDDVLEEILADFTGDALAEPRFLASLASDSPSKFREFLQTVLGWLQRVAEKLRLTGFGSSQYFFDTTQLRDYLREVLTVYAKGGEISDLDRPTFSRHAPAPTFFSQAERVVEAKMPNKATFEQVKNILSPTNGVKPEELKWLGLDDFLKTKETFTKQEVLDFIRQNNVQVQEVTHSDEAPDQAVMDWHDISRKTWDEMDERERVEYRKEYMRDSGRELESPTKFSSYQLPGGQDYRELLLTLPTKINPLLTRFAELDNKNFSDGLSERELREYEHLKAMHAKGELGRDVFNVMHTGRVWKITKNGEPMNIREFPTEAAARDTANNYNEREMRKLTEDQKQNFHSGHWSEPNVLAHVRFNTRMVDGKKVLFLEEIQSDWHQKGRKQGYQSNKWVLKEEDGSTYEVYDTKEAAVRDQIQAANEGNPLALSEVKESGVPDAPFKKTWHELALKRMLRYAAENGYDSLAWTTGEQQAERYDLSKQVDWINYKKNNDGTYHVRFGKGDSQGSPYGGHVLLERTNEPADKLADMVGKELAEKMLRGEGKDWANGGVVKYFSGLDLKVGGEGMKGFYDTILPAFLNKYAKKWGVQVGTAALPPSKSKDDLAASVYGRGETYRNLPSEQKRKIDEMYSERARPTHSIPITEAMKESVVQQGQPLFRRDLTRTRAHRHQHLGRLTDDQAEALEHVHGSPATWAQQIGRWRTDWKRRLSQGLVDQFAPIADLSEKAYMLARMSKGGDGTLEALLLYGKPYVDADGAYRVDYEESRGFTGFAKVLSQLQGEQDRFLEWVAAKRAERLKDVGLENLYSEDDIEVLKTLNQGEMKNGRSRAAAYENALIELNEWNAAMVRIAVNSGLVTEDYAQKLRDLPYVPFYRLHEEEVIGIGTTPGLVNQYAWKRLKGGTEHLNDDLLANLLQNWSHIITASAKNRAADETLHAAEEAGIAMELPAGASTKNTVTVMREGKPHVYAITDAPLMDAIASLHYTGLGSIAKPFTAMKKALTFGVTVNPAYKVRNLIRDTIHSIGTSQLSGNPLKNILEGTKATAKASDTRAQMLAGGGMIRFGTMLDGANADRTRRLIEQGVDEDSVLDDSPKIVKMWKRYVLPAFEAYQEFGDRGEQINRAALYQQLIDKGLTHLEASFWARDLMDFSLHGKWEAVRILTQVVPFMNSRLQGLYKIGRAAKEDPRKLATTLGAVSLASIALMLAYKDDDDWKKREDWDRENYWWFKVGDLAFRIPKPFELGAIGTLAERGVELFASDEMTGTRFRERLGALVLTQLSMNPTPQLFKPMIDLYANRDAFTGKPIETFGMEHLRKEDRATENTSQVARFLGSLGLPDPAKLAMGRYDTLSPVQVDGLIHAYLGWLGTSSLVALDYGIRPLVTHGEKPAMQLRDVFLAGNFVEGLPTNSSRYVTALYDQAKEIEEAYGSFRDAIKRGDREKALSIRDSEAERLRLYPMVERVKRAEADLNRQLKQIERSETLSADEKRRQIDVLKERKHLLAMRLQQRQMQASP